MSFPELKIFKNDFLHVSQAQLHLHYEVCLAQNKKIALKIDIFIYQYISNKSIFTNILARCIVFLFIVSSLSQDAMDREKKGFWQKLYFLCFLNLARIQLHQHHMDSSRPPHICN